MVEIYTITSIACISVLAYFSVQPNMIFEQWLLFWAKLILRREGVDYNLFAEKEDIIDTAKIYNKWIKPLGVCYKCFMPWACLICLLILSIFVDYNIEEAIKIYLTSTLLGIWIVAQT